MRAEASIRERSAAVACWTPWLRECSDIPHQLFERGTVGGRGGDRRVAETSIPEPVAVFIRASITSVWALELLLFLKLHPDKAYRVEELVLELRGSSLLITDVLLNLQRAQLVAQTGEEYRYQPASDELRRLVEELERLSRERPLALRTAILAAPHAKIQVFADAFRFKRN